MKEITENTSEMVRFGQQIREIRISQGKKAKEVAREVGISPVYLWILEKGTNPKTGKPSEPSSEIRRKLFSVLGIFSEEDSIGPKKDESTLRSQYKNMLNSLGKRGNVFDLNVEHTPGGLDKEISYVRMSPSSDTSIFSKFTFDQQGNLKKAEIFWQKK